MLLGRLEVSGLVSEDLVSVCHNCCEVVIIEAVFVRCEHPVDEGCWVVAVIVCLDVAWK